MRLFDWESELIHQFSQQGDCKEYDPKKSEIHCKTEDMLKFVRRAIARSCATEKSTDQVKTKPLDCFGVSGKGKIST